MQTRKLLTLQQAEEMTGRKVATWRKDVRERRVDFVRLGPRQVRIPLEVVQRLIVDGYIEALPQVPGKKPR